MRLIQCSDCFAPIECKEPCDYRGHSHWGDGANRCAACTKTWATRVHAARMRKHREDQMRLNEHIAYYHAHGECPDDGEVCSSCCDHEFDAGEGGYCINGCEQHRSDVA